LFDKLAGGPSTTAVETQRAPQTAVEEVFSGRRVGSEAREFVV
jgi:hypothetical protein